MTTAVAATAQLALPADFGATLLNGAGAILLFGVAGMLLLLIGFYAIDLTTPGKLSALVSDGRPNAVVVTASGMLSMAFIVVVAISGTGFDLTAGLLKALAFGFVGIVAQVAAARMLEWITRIDVKATIESERFAPASLVVAAVHLALGLIVAAAIA